MNNQPKIEAFKSFYQQGKDLYNAGDVVSARDSFIKAAELANDISVTSTSYEVRMEYHKTATKILEFVKKSCVKNPPKPITPKGDDSEKTPEIKAEPKSTISFADVAGLAKITMVGFFSIYFLYTVYSGCQTGDSTLNTYPYIPFWK